MSDTPTYYQDAFAVKVEPLPLGTGDAAFMVGLSETDVQTRIVSPWQEGRPLVVGGHSYDRGTFRIEIRTCPVVMAPADARGSFEALSGTAVDVTDRFITGPHGQPARSPEQDPPATSAAVAADSPAMPSDVPARDVFFSYSHKDYAIARQLVDGLERMGISCWIDEGELLLGDSIIDCIDEAIEKAEFFVALVSENSVDSRWCQRELGHAAIDVLEERNRIRILPLRVGNVELPRALKGVYYGRYDPLSHPEDAILSLADSIRRHRGRLSADPGTPISGAPAVDVGRLVAGLGA